ncbi:basal body-orientation factor 1 isoform X1 [Hydra vulgaris]|uniref:basal body-orientation factor 1 isoform X1 n=1 Tax=Hydra vulgaris TaxID=6087 RepID=UPI0032E9F3F8
MVKKQKKNKSPRKKKEKVKSASKQFVDQEHELKLANVKTHILESQLLAAEASKCNYRENTQILLHENENLHQSVKETEQDAMAYITFLKNEVAQKDMQIHKLLNEVEELKTSNLKEKHDLSSESTLEIERIQKLLTQKENEIKLMKTELRLVKEFQIQRVFLEAELHDIKEKYLSSEKKWELKLSRMKEKFFEEKIWLKHDAEIKLTELTEKVHAEAINNIDETTKSIYKKNFELVKSLEYYIKMSESLSQSTTVLANEKKKLLNERETNNLMVEEKINQANCLRKIIKQLEVKFYRLEKELSQVLSNNKLKNSFMMKKHNEEQESDKFEVMRLHGIIQMKNKELKSMKILSKKIVDERSEIEKFLIESLEYVKNEIIKNRSRFKRDAEMVYNKQMRSAHANLVDFPKICNFKHSKFSTNNIFCYLKDADSWHGVSDKVDISCLTWEQREKVLRLLFAKINGLSFSNEEAFVKAKESLPSIPLVKNTTENKIAHNSGTKTFLTEADELPEVFN